MNVNVERTKRETPKQPRQSPFQLRKWELHKKKVSFCFIIIHVSSTHAILTISHTPMHFQFSAITFHPCCSHNEVAGMTSALDSFNMCADQITSCTDNKRMRFFMRCFRSLFTVEFSEKLFYWIFYATYLVLSYCVRINASQWASAHQSKALWTMEMSGA